MWLGHVSHIQGFGAQIHIAVLPSRREGLPKSLLEAAACGRPMVATDVPGCREVCIAGEAGLLAPVDDPRGLAAALRQLVGDPPCGHASARAGVNWRKPFFCGLDRARYSRALPAAGHGVWCAPASRFTAGAPVLHDVDSREPSEAA